MNGDRVVPVEPTKEMIDAAILDKNECESCEDAMRLIYKAMIAAAPAAAQSQQVIQDAARYRWLKQKDCLTEISNITPDAWDEAIDKFEERSAP